MSFDPFEIEGLNLKRSLRGYDRDEVDRLLQGLAARYADVVRRHAEVREQLERLEGEVARYQEEEQAVAKVLAVAQRAVEEIKDRARGESEELASSARRDAEATLDEARRQAGEIVEAARSERDRVEAEIGVLKELEDELRARWDALFDTMLSGRRPVPPAIQEPPPVEEPAPPPPAIEESSARSESQVDSEPTEPDVDSALEEDYEDEIDEKLLSLVDPPPAPPRRRRRRRRFRTSFLAGATAIGMGIALLVWTISSGGVPFVDDASAPASGVSASTTAGSDSLIDLGGTSTEDAIAPAAATEPAIDGPILLAAGDIAECGPESGDEATAELLGAYPEATIATLGDNAYEDGTLEEFQRCYEPSWGKYKERTRPATGNHEYKTENAQGYFEYFGKRGGPRGRYYYSYDLGAWHIVVLNSECRRVGGCDREDPQLTWLRKDLAANPTRCTLAYWHRPPFSSGRKGAPSDTARVLPMWELLYDKGADVVLAGHEHSYERFVPMNQDGEADESAGIGLFVVGTGGGNPNLRDFQKPPLATTAVREDRTRGVLKLTLGDGKYAWEFLSVEGATFEDSGTGTCH